MAEIEKVIKDLKEVKHEVKVGIASRMIYESTNAIDNAIWTIRELQNQIPKWHLCSEELPNDRQWYLAMFQEVDTGFIGLPYIADYLNGKHTKYTTDDGWIICNCTDREDSSAEYYKKLRCIAWMELPKFEGVE